MRISPLIRWPNLLCHYTCYLIFEGVQTREFLGHPASGRKVRFSLMFMITLKDGKYIEKRAHYNTADILRQLSA
ncbi:ester cyclase [Escherichia coli]|nr:ester cyclase [Escherichia coli]MDD8488485.1 ester cyclase [Escherichia coli]